MNNKAFEIQNQIRRTAIQGNESVRNLKEWETEIKKQEQEMKKQQPSMEQNQVSLIILGIF